MVVSEKQTAPDPHGYWEGERQIFADTGFIITYAIAFSRDSFFVSISRMSALLFLSNSTMPYFFLQ
jgi:hypothetical protein